jgi:hypothetical protein
MAVGQKFLVVKGVDIDRHPSLMTPDVARFIKNLVYDVADTSTATDSNGSSTGSYKPLQANSRYVGDLVLPGNTEDNFPIGYLQVAETREVFVFVHNKEENHTIYKLNGADATYDIVYQGPELRFNLSPEDFVHQGGAWIRFVFITDPDTGEKKRRSFLFFALSNDHLRFLCVEDSVATQSFNGNLFPYFQGDYDKFILSSAHVPTPTGCIGVLEVPLKPDTVVRNNNLLFKPWQFRLMWVDVWGRPSEHGQISDLYLPGGGDCISQSANLPRCLDLSFDAPPPHIDKIQVEYRNCNDQQWYIDETIDLYVGSNLGDWWARPRNPDVDFDSANNKITYRFCREGKCQPVPPSETNRLYNPIPDPQSVFPVGKFIGVGNNADGFNPFSKELKGKVTFSIDTPEQSSDTLNTFRNIELLIEVYNPFKNENSQIYFYDDKYWFGWLISKEVDSAFGKITALSAVPYAQFFANEAQKGFGVYLEGVNAYVITEQYSLDSSGNLEKVTDFTRFDNDKIYFQKATFNNVPRGVYVARVFSHESNPSDLGIDELKKTSTYVAGTYAANFSNPSDPINHSIVASSAKEIVVDVCEKDYSSLTDNKILVIWDFIGNANAVEAGYVYNTNDTTKSQYGVELLRLSAGAASLHSIFTDHNGFYFVASATNRFRFQIYGYCNCNVVELANGRAGATNQLWKDNFYLNDSDACLDYENQECNHSLVKGRVLLCDSDIGVPGVYVTLSRGKSAVTDSNGEFSIIAHDDVLNEQRNDTLYYNTTGCPYTNCDGDCLAPKSVIINKCITCEGREVDTGDVFVLFQSSKGLLSGGVYSVGITGWDEMDRPTFVQPLGNISMPSVYEVKKFSPSLVRAIINATAVFPDKIKYITFWISDETTIEKYITWIVDKVEFVDNTGKENTIAPTQIKIYYASLLEYNKQNNFNTTVSWDFIPQNETEPVISDKVQFLLNGDGQFFEKDITALIKYDQDGQYFLINYSDDLKDLKQNAIIRLIRPRICDVQQVYFELCGKVEIENGSAQINSIILNAFDTYYLSRQIPVPVQLSEEETIIENRVIGVPFEHGSPSDFWGDGCRNIGRVNTDNPYEAELYHRDQIALSGALSENGQLNFLTYFDKDKKFSFDEANINGIVSVLYYPGVLLVIGQSNNFLVGFDDNLVRINADGTAQAGSIKGSFGRPQIKTSGNYGCRPIDKNTISRHENIVQWLDSSRATVVQHNYIAAIQVTQADPKIGVPGGIDSWVRPKIKAIDQYNLENGNKRFFHGVINPVNREYLLTDFIIGSGVYISPDRQPNISTSETVSFNTVTRFWKGWYGFTPEMYAPLQGELSAQQLFSFKNGLPYKNYSVGATVFGTFFGEKVNRVVEFVPVIDGMNKKRFNSISQYCKQSQYFCDKVVTENGQESRILLERWMQAEFGWHGPFLCDLNTPFSSNRPKQTGDLKILEGNVMYGNYCIVRMIGDPSKDDQYSELQGIVVYVSPNSIT